MLEYYLCVGFWMIDRYLLRGSVEVVSSAIGIEMIIRSEDMLKTYWRMK